MKTKLGKRLNEIFDFIGEGYEECWDTCCDHGKLGLALLESQKVKKVHFVDQVDSIVEKLRVQIESIADIKTASYELYSLDAKAIRLTSKSSIICICGVGADVAMGIIESLGKYNDISSHDFLISANYHMYELRDYLFKNNFLSVEEKFFYDGKWPYELLLVSKSRGSVLNRFGETLFEKESKEKKKYILNLVEHYKKKGFGNKDFLEIAGQYEKIVTKWNI